MTVGWRIAASGREHWVVEARRDRTSNGPVVRARTACRHWIALARDGEAAADLPRRCPDCEVAVEMGRTS